jgi:hypothetical protein
MSVSAKDRDSHWAMSDVHFQVIFALKRIGRPIYGFDPETHVANREKKGTNFTHRKTRGVQEEEE